METLAFVQGVVSVIGILMVGGIVWAINQIVKINHNIEDIHRIIEGVSDHCVRINEKLESDLQMQVNSFDTAIEDTYRQMDSRFDKLENRLSKKQILND